MLSTSFAFDSAALKSVLPPGTTLMLIQFSMLALFASVARTSVELYASADDEKTTTVAKSVSVSVLSTAFAAALAIPIRVPDIEPETSTTTTTSFGPAAAAAYQGR